MKDLTSLKEIADFLRKKAVEIEDAYFLNAVKLLKAADILDPNDDTEEESKSPFIELRWNDCL